MTQSSHISRFTPVWYHQTRLKFISARWQAEMSAPFRGLDAPRRPPGGLFAKLREHKRAGETRNRLALCCCVYVVARKDLVSFPKRHFNSSSLNMVRCHSNDGRATGGSHCLYGQMVSPHALVPRSPALQARPHTYKVMSGYAI